MINTETILYKNDLRQKSHTGINVSLLKQINHPIINDPNNLLDMDTLEYRINETIELNSDSLDLSGLGLKKIPNGVSKEGSYGEPTKLPNELPIIHNLFLSDNKLQFSSLTPLQYYNTLLVLDISNCKINNIDYLPETLIELVCRNNNLVSMPHPLPQNLIRLDVSYNRLIKLPKSNSLKQIICDNNKISKISSYPNLLSLSCKNNLIKTMRPMKNLVSLDCSYNFLEKIYGFVELEYLCCSNNNIMSIFNLPKINQLECFNNKIVELDYFKGLEILVSDNIHLNSDYKINSKVIDKFGILHVEFSI